MRNGLIGEIVGKTPTKIEHDDYEIKMYFSDGSSCRWYHMQDCCEDVRVDDIVGDFNDLLNNPLLIAEEREGETGWKENDYDSYTWTFYTFRNIGGSVDVKWYGTSNGYYSERVDFEFNNGDENDSNS